MLTSVNLVFSFLAMLVNPRPLRKLRSNTHAKMHTRNVHRRKENISLFILNLTCIRKRNLIQKNVFKHVLTRRKIAYLKQRNTTQKHKSRNCIFIHFIKLKFIKMHIPQGGKIKKSVCLVFFSCFLFVYYLSGLHLPIFQIITSRFPTFLRVDFLPF